MKLYDRIKHTVESQIKTNYTDESQIECISYLMHIEMQCVAIQFAQYILKKGGSTDYTSDLFEFMNNHYNEGD